MTWWRDERSGQAALLGLVLAATACQTGAPSEPVAIPVVLQPLFETCEPNDGALTLQIFKAEGIVSSLDVAWKAKEHGDWELEATNAIGIELLHLNRAGAHIATSGKAADRVPEPTVLSDGFLAFGGEPIGIKAGEIPCILGFRLPRSWMALTRSIETEDHITTLRLGDERRDLTITLKNASEDAGAVCTQISWSKWLIFHTHLTWCQNPNAHGGPAVKRRQASLTGVDDYQLKWVSADD